MTMDKIKQKHYPDSLSHPNSGDAEKLKAESWQVSIPGMGRRTDVNGN